MILYRALFNSTAGASHYPPALFNLQTPAEFQLSVDAVFVRGKQTERVTSAEVKLVIKDGTLNRSAWIPTHGMVAERRALRFLLKREVARVQKWCEMSDKIMWL
jgi:hypothetical protein